MPAPQVVTDDSTADDEPEPEPEPEEAMADPFDGADDATDGDYADEIEVETTEAEGEEVKEELAEPVFADAPGDDFFDGADDAPGIHPEGIEDDTSSSGTQAPPGPDAAEEDDRVGFEDSINSGFARLAVVGLDEDDGKDELREEFREVMEEFKLGHYGDEVMQEYMLESEDDIHPIWGFCGALVLCFGLVIYMRPDGDEIMESVTDTLGSFGSLPDKLKRN